MKGNNVNKFKKTVATLALAGTLALTGGTAAQVITAKAESPAQAYSVLKVEKWQTDRYWNGTRWMCGVWQLRNYDAYEEWILRKVDGWYRVYYAYC
jgi:hypothetical protein